jgi:hypothetical protein
MAPSSGGTEFAAKAVSSNLLGKTEGFIMGQKKAHSQRR